MKKQKIFCGFKIKQAREDLGLKQFEMADKLNISREYLNYLENDKKPITIAIIKKLKMATGKDIEHWRN